MLITKESDYAIRVIRVLSDYEKRNLKEICKMENIPNAYGYKIIRKLVNAQLIECFLGASGGYQLVADLQEITLYDIVAIIEPGFAVAKCINETCSQYEERRLCLVHQEFAAIQGQIVVMLKRKSIAEVFQL